MHIQLIQYVNIKCIFVAKYTSFQFKTFRNHYQQNAKKRQQRHFFVFFQDIYQRQHANQLATASPQKVVALE